VRATLEETFRLLVQHLHLFTLLSLTVWLPTHIALNYLEFFAEPAPGRAFRVAMLVQMVFDPLVVCATLVALARVKQGLPLGYLPAMIEGLRAWGRLALLRLLVTLAVVIPAVAGAAAARTGRASLLGAAALLALTGVTMALLVRFAVVDAVVVLEGRSVATCWGRASALTAGRRRAIVGTTGVLFALVFSAAILVAQVLRGVPELNHFVVRVLLDCVLSVSQSLFTIALFLFYWRARAETPAVSAS
jgi:hypothetical protein